MFEGLAEAIIILLIISGIAILISLALKISSRWVLYKKCGEEGWKSLIPIYTDLTLLKVSGLNWWWIFLIYAGSIAYIFGMVLSIVRLDYSSDYSSSFSVINSMGSFVGLITLFAKFNIGLNLSKKFNESAGYAVLIMFFEPIMFFILGLSKSQEYDETVEVSENGVFGFKTETETNVFCPECGTKGKSSDIYCNNCGKKMR